MDEQTKIPPIESYDIDHLGIVASVMDEIGLVEQIDQILGGIHQQEHLSSGQLVKAMILNGLEASSPLPSSKSFSRARPPNT